MPTYVIAETQEIVNEEAYIRYRPLGAQAVLQHQGSFLVRGGTAQTLEGDWHPSKLTILEFPTSDLAKAWDDSPEYTAARKVREGAARMRFVAVESL